MNRVEKIVLGLLSILVMVMVGTYLIDQWGDAWDSFTPGQGEFVGQLISAFSVAGAIAITIMILRHQLGEEERGFDREKKHRIITAARAHLPPVEKLAFGSIETIKIWADVQFDMLKLETARVQEHDMHVLPDVAFDLVWPDIRDDDVAGLPTYIAQEIYYLKANVSYLTKEAKAEPTSFSARHARLSVQLSVVGNAIHLRAHLLSYLNLIDQEDPQSVRARKILKKAFKVAERLQKKYQKELQERFGVPR